MEKPDIKVKTTTKEGKTVYYAFFYDPETEEPHPDGAQGSGSSPDAAVGDLVTSNGDPIEVYVSYDF